MDVRSLTSAALSASFKTQNEMQTLTQRLSSGLRINSAADDPSGLAIAETLASKVNGLDEGAQQLQTAGNALTVADGALSTMNDILERMRALVVEASSDLQSASDKSDIQSELNQLMLEINRISANTTFNGKALLDGSSSSALPLGTRALLVENPEASGGGYLLDTTVDPDEPAISPTAQQVVQSLSVDSYDPVADALNVTVTIESTDPTFGPSQTATIQVGNDTNYELGFSPPTPGTPSFSQMDQNNNQVLSFNIGTLTQADVGKTAVLVTLPAQEKAPGSAMQVNSGDAEGDTVAIDIPAVNATNLGVNQVQLGDDLETQAAEYRVDYAISTLGSLRATIGAQMVSVQEAADNATTASVNTEASESAIRDVDVGAAVTEFTRAQIQTQFQTKLVADAEHLSQSVATLVSDSIVS
ncbi:MAG TPA: flagellin [Candidatus Baltobacteraceae bacterium]|nr:flagellin [Candidatus Baltobacteraceae bacterium]